MESLRLENSQLKNELTSLKKDSDHTIESEVDKNGQNLVSNGHINREEEVEQLRKDNDELRKRLGVLENGKEDTELSGNGLSEDKKKGEELPNGVNEGQRSVKLKKEPAAAGPSGTSLVTGNIHVGLCLL